MKTLLSVHQVAVFHHVQQASSWTTVNEIVTATGVSMRTVGIHCKNLTKDGIFERERVAYPEFRYRLAHDPPRPCIGSAYKKASQRSALPPSRVPPRHANRIR